VPFAGNIIPASRINPSSLKLADAWPLPNNEGDVARSYVQNFNNPLDKDQGNLRIDQHLSDKDHLMGRYSQTRSDDSNPSISYNGQTLTNKHKSGVYWMQNDAPRADGGTGWPGLRLCGDALGTEDGFAMAPYIRESRRIRARKTIVEQEVSAACRERAEPYADSVGVGYYRIDLHPSTGGDNYLDVPALPFRIPLGALVPVRLRNLLPAAKNIGTTHITNGCYRLHPVEWNIGEVAGLLAAWCAARGVEPQQVADRFGEFQAMLVRQGIEPAWPEERWWGFTAHAPWHSLRSRM
jgi:FAD dependent oxidoreductase